MAGWSPAETVRRPRGPSRKTASNDAKFILEVKTMINKTKHMTSNYKMILPFVKQVRLVGPSHFISDGYMDLVIEDLEYVDYSGNPVFSIAHYGKQNGDMMRDPEMTFSLNPTDKTITPISFQNDYLGMYQEVFKEKDGKTLYSPSLLRQLDTFLNEWLHNIINQGFTVSNYRVIG